MVRGAKEVLITMHAEAKYEIKKRQELQNYSEVVVKISENELKWLVPFGEQLKGKIKPMPLEPKDFTIKDFDRGWETILAVHEENLGRIVVYGYPPTNYIDKHKSMPGEYPFFSVTMQFALGTVSCIKFEGSRNSKNETEICNEVLQRVVPVILYMQNYLSYAIVSKRKISIGTGKQKRAITQRIYKPKRFENPIPETQTFLGKNVKIEKPQFQNLDDIKEGIVLTIESRDDIEWLQEFAEDIRKENRKAARKGEKIEYPFFDETKIHNISAIRVYVDKKKNEKSFMQLQIHNIENQTYQIDYFDEELMDECQMIILADLCYDPVRYDIVYVAGDGEVTGPVDEYARRLVILLMDAMTYLRPYQENGEKEEVAITKLPEIF